MRLTRSITLTLFLAALIGVPAGLPGVVRADDRDRNRAGRDYFEHAGVRRVDDRYRPVWRDERPGHEREERERREREERERREREERERHDHDHH